jgi:hypothetical protein
MTEHPSESQTPKQSRDGFMAILNESRGAHETSQRLLPLLSLLESPDGQEDPLGELKELLGTIITILGQHSASLDELKSGIGRRNA